MTLMPDRRDAILIIILTRSWRYIPYTMRDALLDMGIRLEYLEDHSRERIKKPVLPSG